MVVCRRWEEVVECPVAVTYRNCPLTFYVDYSGAKVHSFQTEQGAYGKMWARVAHGDENYLPSIKEIMHGLFQWYSLQVKRKVSARSVNE